MKRLFAFVLVLLAGLAFAEVPQLDLYLLIGQSNMAGRGKLTEANRLPTEGVWKLDKRGALTAPGRKARLGHVKIDPKRARNGSTST